MPIYLYIFSGSKQWSNCWNNHWNTTGNCGYSTNSHYCDNGEKKEGKVESIYVHESD